MRKYWFHKEIVFVESEKNKWSEVIWEEHADGGSFLLAVVIDNNKYSLFNHFSSSGKVSNIYRLLLGVIEKNET